MGSFKVTLTALVGGNPHKAWRGTTGEEDTVHVPDDVWQDQSYPFAGLDEAKAFILALPGTYTRDDGTLLSGESTTHVVLIAVGDDGTEEILYVQDFGHDSLDAAEPGVVPPSGLPPVPVVEDDTIPEAPPLLAEQ